MTGYFQEALWLAVIQGVTEAFPISSTAHLMLFSMIKGIGEHTVQMDVALHLGTLLSWVVIFRKDLISFITGMKEALFGRKNPAFQEVQALIVATLPVVVVGFGLSYFGIHPRGAYLLAINTLIFGLLFYVADKWGKNQHKGGVQSWKEGAIWGLFQAMALFPGVSRLGICITGGRVLGYSPQAAVRFSFLMGIPSVAGALVLKAPEIMSLFQGDDKILYLKLVGISFLINIPCVKLFQMWVARRSMSVFAGYRIFLGIILLWILMR